MVEPLASRSRSARSAHGRYESWILDQVVPWIHDDCGGAQEIVTTGVQPRRLPRGELRAQARRPVPARALPVGQLRPGRRGTRWGERGEATYFNNPIDYVAHLRGDHLDWLRGAREPAARVRAGHVGGHDRGAGEHARFAGLLGDKGIRHELDLWGHDVPHDWPSWRAQIAHHLPRFC